MGEGDVRLGGGGRWATGGSQLVRGLAWSGCGVELRYGGEVGVTGRGEAYREEYIVDRGYDRGAECVEGFVQVVHLVGVRVRVG